LISNCACEKLAGIEKKQLVVQSEAGPPSCTLAISNAVGLRIANLITTDQKIDVCIRAAGTQFPTLPIFAGSGSSCPTGVGYGQYTVPLAIEPGTYDIKLVLANGTCSDDGPTVSGVDVTGSQSVSLIAFGSSMSPNSANLVSLADATDKSNYVYVRLFHALINEGAVDVGVTRDSTIPTTIAVPIFPNVPFGQISARNGSTLPVDDAGYMIYANSGNDPGALWMGARPTGDTSVFLTSVMYLTKSHHYDLFLMGDVAQPLAYPPRLWSCDEGVPVVGGYFAECGDPRDTKIGIFHPNLTDFFTDYVDQREGPALDAIATSATSTPDVLCLPELYSPEVRQQLAKRFPANNKSGISVVFSDSFTPWPNSDLTDQYNQPVTWPDTSCTGDLKAALGDLRDCLFSLPCVTTADTADASSAGHYFAIGGSAAIGCVSGGASNDSSCVTQLTAFLGQMSHEADACYMCAITHLSSGESIEDMYSACTSSTGFKPHYVYGGSTGLALLTRLPLADETPEVIALPASNWNRAALRVPLRLANNAVVDFWCAAVRAPNSEPFIQNGGPYYGDDTGAQALVGNSAEEKLQIQRLISAVNSRAASAQRRAIVLALTYTSPLVTDSRNNALTAELVPENFALFGQSRPIWEELVASSWVPACTWCGDNPLNNSLNSEWIVHMFGVGITAQSVTDTARTFTSPAVTLTFYDSHQDMTPVSQYYGLQSTVRVSQ
jgi:hypothetical protein